MKKPTKIMLFTKLLLTEIELAEYNLDLAYENGDYKDINHAQEIVKRYRSLYDSFITCFSNPQYEIGEIK